MEVRVNVYSLHQSNRFLSPLGLGAYHSGVQINGKEYSFSAQGISRTEPRLEVFGELQESIVMGTFDGGMARLNHILLEFDREQFAPGTYHVADRNCNAFSQALCVELLGEEAGKLPGWINRAASIASWLMGEPPQAPTGSAIRDVEGAGAASAAASVAAASSSSSTPPAPPDTSRPGLSDKQREMLAKMKQGKKERKRNAA